MSIKTIDFQGSFSASMNEVKKNHHFQNKGQELSHFLSSQQRIDNEKKKLKIQQSEKTEYKKINNKPKEKFKKEESKKKKKDQKQKVTKDSEYKGQHIDILI